MGIEEESVQWTRFSHTIELSKRDSYFWCYRKNSENLWCLKKKKKKEQSKAAVIMTAWDKLKILSSDGIDIVDRIILLGRKCDCSVNCRIFSSIPVLYPLDTSGTPLSPAETAKNVSRYCQMTPCRRGGIGTWLKTSEIYI